MRAFRSSAIIAFVLIVVIGLGCQTAPRAESVPAPLPSRGEWMIRTELGFGLGRNNAPDVSDREWQDFVDREITPRFPDGLTILDSHGQWRGKDGVVRREPSRIVVIIHPATEEADKKIEAIRESYKQKFSQESVLCADEWERVSF